jgi:hypothetical protein
MKAKYSLIYGTRGHNEKCNKNYMMGKKLLVLTILSAVSNIANAQVNYNFKARNAIGYSNTVLHPLDISDFKQNRHTIVYQRIINRRTILIFDYSFSKNKLHIYTYKKPSLGIEDPNATSTSNSINLYDARPGNIYFKTSGYSLGIRKFMRSKGSLAPYGSFVEIKAGHDRLSRTPKDSLQYYFQGKRLNEHLPNAGIDHIDFITLHVGFGATRAITKNLSFTWVLNFGINIPIYKNYSEEQSPGDARKSYVLNDDEYFFNHADRSYQNSNSLNLSLGLNYSF